MKSLSLAINALFIGAIAAATCDFKVTYYSNTDCTGTEGPLTGTNLPIGSTVEPTDASTYMLGILACDPVGVI